MNKLIIALIAVAALVVLSGLAQGQPTVQPVTTQSTLKVVPANPNSVTQSSSSDGLFLQGAK